MSDYTIKFSDVNSVNRFVDIVKKFDCPMDLEQGRYKVNAKSVMGIFSLDIVKPIVLHVYSDDSTDLCNLISEFIV